MKNVLEIGLATAYRLGDLDRILDTQNWVFKKLGLVGFRAEILNWSEMAFANHYVTPSIETLLGYPLRQFTPDFFFDILHPEDMDARNNPPIGRWKASFRLCNSAGVYVPVTAECFVEGNIVGGVMSSIMEEQAGCIIKGKFTPCPFPKQ